MRDDYFSEEIDKAIEVDNKSNDNNNGEDTVKDEEQEKEVVREYEKKESVEEAASSVDAKITKRQMNVTLDALERSKSDIVDITKKLEVHVNNLVDESLIINQVPSKLARQLKEIIPEISKEVKVQCLTDLDQGMKTCYSNLAKLDDILIAATNRITNLESDKLRKFAILMTVVVVVSVLSSSAATYFMMKKFPPFVEIKTNSDVQIDNSRVHVFSQKDPIVKKVFEQALPSKK